MHTRLSVGWCSGQESIRKTPPWRPYSLARGVFRNKEGKDALGSLQGEESDCNPNGWGPQAASSASRSRQAPAPTEVQWDKVAERKSHQGLPHFYEFSRRMRGIGMGTRKEDGG